MNTPAHLTSFRRRPTQPAPPPSFADIMKSFSKDGNGDSQTLLAILSAKQAEEDVSQILNLDPS